MSDDAVNAQFAEEFRKLKADSDRLVWLALNGACVDTERNGRYVVRDAYGRYAAEGDDFTTWREAIDSAMGAKN